VADVVVESDDNLTGRGRRDLAGEALDCADVNALAGGSCATIRLLVTDGVSRRELIWTDKPLAAALARRLIEELNELEPDRLRRCARPECDLLFYDDTVRTRRWHAEDPCGWRERQRVHRLRPSSRVRRNHPTSRRTR
jgi:predicted RNA-binding Zn ribbon-like protein